jgi:hypothetical protein
MPRPGPFYIGGKDKGYVVINSTPPLMLTMGSKGLDTRSINLESMRATSLRGAKHWTLRPVDERTLKRQRTSFEIDVDPPKRQQLASPSPCRRG